MSSPFLYPFKSGKNTKFTYFTKGVIRSLIPGALLRKRLPRVIEAGLAEYDPETLEERVGYYNKLSAKTPLSADAPRLAEHVLTKKGIAYFFDTEEYTRFFPQRLRWRHIPGDVTYIPPEPSIVKSRPIAGNNANSVLLKLNKVRHFIFIKSDIPFQDKRGIAVFRGKVPLKQKRIDLFEKHFGNPSCDLGNTCRRRPAPAEWSRPKMTIQEQLQYKFILALEGNDVASNLKWVMSSNSIAVMPKPEFETWFMEGRLIPNEHYIEVSPDFSDLDEKLRYYSTHEDEAMRIIDAAHRYVDQFRDQKLEKLLSLLVLQKYFALTN